jgi:hypothetical protein
MVNRSPRFQQTPFARALTEHVRAWRARQDGSRDALFAHWADGIHPAYRDLALTAITEDEVRLHDYAAAITSSQIFAVNLFIPWRTGPKRALERMLEDFVGQPLTVERVAFEWVPPGALLGEIDGDRPRPDEAATGVDVVLWCVDAVGKKAAVMLEVKLGEGGFTNCGGRESPANERPDVCASAAKFFSDPTACYLRRPKRKTRDRRYWEIFTRTHGSVSAAFPGATLDGACPFAGEQQQPMRNLALAQALVQEGLVARAWFGLCHHDQNPDVAREWRRWKELLPPDVSAPALLASRVLRAGHDDGHPEWAAWMAARYRLELT